MTEINLGDKGLEETDTIDGYLQDHFVSGNRVLIPEGAYRWEGEGLQKKGISNAELVGKGDVKLVAPDGNEYNGDIRAGSGTVALRNITFKGVKGLGGPNKSWQCGAGAGATLEFENVAWPDGSEDPSDAHGMYVMGDAEGQIDFIDCHIEGFGDNGLYASPPDNACVRVIGGTYKNNNIANVRVGSELTIVRNVDCIQDDLSPEHPNGARRQRGIWVRDGADQTYIGQCNVVHTIRDASPINVPQGERANGIIEDVAIQNNSGYPAINNRNGSWRGTNIDITGEGDLSIMSGEFRQVTRGEGADIPNPDEGEDTVSSHLRNALGDLQSAVKAMGGI